MSDRNKGSDAGTLSIIKGPGEPRVLEKGLPIVKVDVKIPVVQPPKGDK